MLLVGHPTKCECLYTGGERGRRVVQRSSRVVQRFAEAEALVERSLLPNAEWKLKYRRFLQKRTRQLAGT